LTTFPTLLIDGDEFLYRGCVAVEHETRWDEDNHILASNFHEALEAVHSALKTVTDQFIGSPVRIAFTKGESFRKGLYSGYKASRANQRKPLCFARVREALEAEFQTYSYPGLEADDILGIWATRDQGDYIIVSQDKDLKTIPGALFQKGTLTKITPEEADYNWLFQTLTGDQVDGYPGCPGIGPVKAQKVLNDQYPGETRAEAMWRMVVLTYEKAGLTPEDALTQARLARILRATDWDAKTKEIKLWTPV